MNLPNNLLKGRWIANPKQSLALFSEILSAEYPEVYAEFLAEKPQSENDYQQKVKNIIFYFTNDEKVIFWDKGNEMHFFYKIAHNILLLCKTEMLLSFEEERNFSDSFEMEIKEISETTLKLFSEDNAMALFLDFENTTFKQHQQNIIHDILKKANIKKEYFEYEIPDNIFEAIIDKIWYCDAPQTFIHLLEKTLTEAPERLEELAEKETQAQILNDIANENYTFQSDRMYIFQNSHTTITGFFDIKEHNIILLYKNEYEIFQKLQVLSLNNKNFIFKAWDSTNEDDYFTLVYKL